MPLLAAPRRAPCRLTTLVLGFKHIQSSPPDRLSTNDWSSLPDEYLMSKNNSMDYLLVSIIVTSSFLQRRRHPSFEEEADMGSTTSPRVSSHHHLLRSSHEMYPLPLSLLKRLALRRESKKRSSHSATSWTSIWLRPFALERMLSLELAHMSHTSRSIHDPQQRGDGGIALGMKQRRWEIGQCCHGLVHRRLTWRVSTAAGSTAS